MAGGGEIDSATRRTRLGSWEHEVINSLVHLKTCVKHLLCARHSAEHWDHCSVQEGHHHPCRLGADSLVGERSPNTYLSELYGSMGFCWSMSQEDPT